ncbi:MAG: hypothetical protein Tsb0015_01910 [Simkaniaceae bacterium]
MVLEINNEFYNELGKDWYTRADHPVALLRAENRIRIPWVVSEVSAFFPEKCKILDIGCGAGFLSNALAKNGHEVFGIDLSQESLEIAKIYDDTETVAYQKADALALPYENSSFDVVCAMDILEHVPNPELLISEAARVLKKGGCFFFHTFNRNLLSYITVIKGVEWFVPNTPSNMHVYPLFIKPKELKQMCCRASLSVEYLLGFSPKLMSKALLQLIFKKKINDRFPFQFSKQKWTGYSGMAKRTF